MDTQSLYPEDVLQKLNGGINNMKQFIKDFFRIGLMSCIGGPVILVIIYGVMGAKGVIETISYTEVVKGILTSALLAFIAGGSGTIYVIEKLPLFVTALIHGVVLYLDYILIYLFNGWIKNQVKPILVFTISFVAGYLVIWIIIYFSTKAGTKKLNKKINS